jgi:crotonobetainyl-CoA:carnitine CoA-transferase CaiB-like acyl-CoA transferase
MSETTKANGGPLSDLRVLELGQLIAGPFCGQLLGDFGAEVIKIEQPGAGDPMRAWGRDHAVWWPIVSRNKKAVTLNLRTPEGQDILRKLVAKSDFLLENFRPGTLEKWNLGYEELSKINPRLIMIRVSGYGQTGPYAGRAGYGSIGEAMGGMRYLAGDPSTPPSRIGLSIGDSLAATYACVGALTALHNRERTGKGQVVDSAIYEAVLAMMESTIPEYTEGGIVRERTGSILPGIAPSNVYPTADNEMVLIGANQDTVFKRLAAAMGRPALGSDPRYATHHARGERQTELDDLISDWSRTLKTDALLARMNEFGVPAGKMFTAPDMLADPHFKARKAIIDVDHPTLKHLKMQNVFPKLSDTPGSVKWAGPPELGQHNAEVYRELLGYDAEKLAELAKAGTI